MIYGSGLRNGDANISTVPAYTQVNVGIKREFPAAERSHADDGSFRRRQPVRHRLRNQGWNRHRRIRAAIRAAPQASSLASRKRYEVRAAITAIVCQPFRWSSGGSETGSMNTFPFRMIVGCALATLSLAQPCFAQQKAATAAPQAPGVVTAAGRCVAAAGRCGSGSGARGRCPVGADRRRRSGRNAHR